MSDYILVTMFAAVPFGLILGMLIAKSIMAMDEQISEYGMDGLILIEVRD
jgi:hypothetical protein